MTFAQYQIKLVEIDERYRDERKRAMIEFCNANNPHNIGDIVVDHIGAIKIESISYDYGSFGAPPCCVYTGLLLKKNLTPTKKNDKRKVYQPNIKQ